MRTKVTQPVSIFPIPLSDPTYPDQDASIQRVDGRCAPFCSYDHVPATGATVAEHGTVCRSNIVAHAWADDADGRRADLWTYLVKPYLNGVYPTSEVHQPQRVELALNAPAADGGYTDAQVYLTADQARAIAAGLMRVAYEIEHPDQPLSNERDRREAEARTEGQA